MPPEAPALRPFWSGTLSFGLVSVPVDLYPGQRRQGVSLRMLAADGTPLARRYFCPKEGKELSSDQIVRGYEVDSGEFVVVQDEELEALEPQKSRDIDLQVFVERSQIAPLYFDRSYFLTPAGSSTKAYRLLAQTMERTGRAGIATFIMRGKEYLVAILSEEGILRAETLRFESEVRTPDFVGLPETVKPPAKQVTSLKKEIRRLAEDDLDEDELADRDTERLRQVIASKAEDEVVHAAAPEDEEELAQVVDLMEVLKRQLAG